MARKFLDYTGVSYLWQKIVAELNKKANNQDLATVATSGSYNDLINKPAIPTKVSDLQDDSGHYIKPVGGIPAQDLAETYLTQHQDISGKANSADLAAVATSGSYNDLLNVPTNVSTFTNDAGYLTQHQDISGKANSVDLATVATSGSYNDLSNKPFIPSAVSDLTDDSGHYTKPVGGIPAADLAETYLTSFTETDPTVPSWAKAAQKPSYTAAEVGAPTVAEMNTAIGTAIGNINSFDMAVVQELPSQDISTHTIYLVPKTGETNDVYDEYVYINSNWEMVGNTQIDLSNYVQKTDYASTSSAGVVRILSGSGISVNDVNGSLYLDIVNKSIIQAGTQVYGVIPPSRLHTATFYGLAKAAGDTTQSQSDNAVGTYTTEAKAAIRSMLGAAASADIPDTSIYVTKESIDNAGITDRTYVTVLNGKFTVTTAASQDYSFPYARANVTGRFNKENQYRVTVNEVEYILSTRLWYIATSSEFKVYEYLGNLGLYISDISGVPGGTDEVPFIIISDIDGNGSIDILTNNAGTYTILVEKIVDTQIKIPNTLIYGDNYAPIEKNNNSGTYNGFSIGVNELTNKRGTIAIGYGNKITSNFSTAIGIANEVSGGSSVVLGNRSKATGLNSYAEGYQNIASGDYSHAEGVTSTASGLYSHAETGGNTASGDSSHAEGYSSVASGNNSHAEGYSTEASGYGSHSGGMASIANGMASIAHGINSIANKGCQAVFGKNNIVDNSQDTFGTYMFILGNGASKTAKSNAVAFDWNGTAHYAGDVYVGANADSTGGTRLATVTEVAAKLDATEAGLKVVRLI